MSDPSPPGLVDRVISMRFALTVVFVMAVVAPARAQGVSFSSMSRQEECADMARRLTAMKGATFARRLRQYQTESRGGVRSSAVSHPLAFR